MNYPVYSLKEMGNYPLGFDDRGSDAAKIRNHTDYAGKNVSVPPNSDSGYFIMVVFRVTALVAGDSLSGCTVRWRSGGHDYHKSFTCSFGLGG